MRKITYTAVFAAIIYIFTAFIKIPLANQTYMHAGNVIITAAACLTGPAAGAAAAVIGSVLADLFVAPVWIPYTIVIKILVGLFIGIGYKKKSTSASALFYTLAGLSVVCGYYIAEAILFGNWLAPVLSIAPLALEYTLGLFGGLLIVKRVSNRFLP